MKFFNLIIYLVHRATKGRGIIFLVATPLFFGASCTPAEKPAVQVVQKKEEKTYEAIWWKDLHVQAIPMRDKNNAIFALRLALTNRSAKDTAIFERQGELEQAFFLYFLAPTKIQGKPEALPIETITMQFTAPDTSPKIPPVLSEIAPGKQLSFCLKFENYILPNQTIAPDAERYLSLSIMSMLAWKRSTGIVTPFYREKDADYRVLPDYDPPKFVFGDQKIRIHKNLTCDDVGK